MSIVSSIFRSSVLAVLTASTISATALGAEEDKVAKGSSIMTEVFHRFHINYEMSRTHKVGYYQEAMENTEGIHYLAESIVDIYVPHNISSKSHASIKPLRARKVVFEDVNAENVLFGNASDMARCSIWRPNSFLSEKNRDNYTFRFKDDSLFHRFKVHVIEFKPVNSKGNVSGTILVDQSSLAILHIDYKPDATASKLWKEVTWTEEWYFTEGKYELSKVKFEGLSSKNRNEYSATLVMQHVKVLSQIPESDSFLDADASIFEHAKEYSNETFWKGYQDLKHDVEVEHVVHLAAK